MQLDNAQMFLRLVEKARTICTFDIESTGLRCDYNSVLVVSVKPYHKKPRTFFVNTSGDDKELVNAAARELEKFDCWISYYGKGFDFPMLQGRLLLHGLPPLQKRHHLDMYYHINAHTNTARKSQGHRISWLGTPEPKMSVSAQDWNESVIKFSGKVRDTMIARCESDVKGLEGLYDRTKHLVINVTR